MAKRDFERGRRLEKARLKRARMEDGRMLGVLEQIEECIAYYENDPAKRADAAGRLEGIRDYRRMVKGDEE
jgi:hypothetical protein